MPEVSCRKECFHGLQSIMVKALCIWFCWSLAFALPTLEEASRILSSNETKKRDELTRELWEADSTSLPLLVELMNSDDPEVSRRATFVHQRLKMGLRPDSSPELLALTNSLQRSSPLSREGKLKDLLAIPEGLPVAMALLMQWSEESPLDLKLFDQWVSLTTQSLIESRSYWRTFFSLSLKARCRGAFIKCLDDSDMPMAPRMIELLAIGNTSQIFQCATEQAGFSQHSSYEAFARVFILNGEVKKALDLLFQSLPQSDEYLPARQIAFLEQFSKDPPRQYKGLHGPELEVLRSRLPGDDQSRSLGENLLPGSSFLTLEHSLITGSREPPGKDLLISDLARTLHLALMSYTDEPSRIPDIESLSATITNEGGRLARALYLLGAHREAAQTLIDHRQKELAIRLLWMTGHENKARDLAGELINGVEERVALSARLTIAELLGRAGKLSEAREIFAPVLKTQTQSEVIRRKSITLGRRLYGREKILELMPDLTSESPYQRGLAMSSLLPYHPSLSAQIFEDFREKSPHLPASQILLLTEEHLSQDREQLLVSYQTTLLEKSKAALKTTDPIYQLALFLRSPIALEIIETHSWKNLDTQELERIIIDDEWTMELRQRALAIALQIHPSDPLLRALDYQWNQKGSPELIALLTLGDTQEAQRIDSQVKINRALSLTVELCDPNTYSGIQCLHLAAHKAFDRGDLQETVRFFESAVIGELVYGTQPTTGYQSLTQGMVRYLKARAALAKTPSSRSHWEKTLESWMAFEN